MRMCQRARYSGFMIGAEEMRSESLRLMVMEKFDFGKNNC